MFVITVKTILISRHFGPKMGHNFVRYKREFVLTGLYKRQCAFEIKVLKQYFTVFFVMKVFARAFAGRTTVNLQTERSVTE